jgi:broad specificity phosphatase PhoE
VAKYLELRRHTDNDDDALSAEGVREALEIGAGLEGNYELLVSTGAQRATQTLACFVAALGQKVPGGVVVEEGLRSEIEDRWKAAYREADSGELDALRSADPELVEQTRPPLDLLCVECSTAYPTVDGRWWSVTVLPTRPQCSASPARWWHPWRRAAECS